MCRFKAALAAAWAGARAVGVVFSRGVAFSVGGGPCITVLVASAVLSALSRFILETVGKKM